MGIRTAADRDRDRDTSRLARSACRDASDGIEKICEAIIEVASVAERPALGIGYRKVSARTPTPRTNAKA
jgi:hypothetical protein